MADIGALAGVPAAAGFTALFAATAAAGYRLGALPPAVAGICAAAALRQACAFFVGTTDNGALAPDGFIGAVIPFATSQLRCWRSASRLYGGGPIGLGGSRDDLEETGSWAVGLV